MILIAGLGNYGTEYEKTRHNYGFMVIDAFQKENDFPDFKLDKNSNSLVSMEGNIILVKPQTYMNSSGKAVKKIADYYKIKHEDIIVIHDDVDVNLGEIKLAEDRGSAGHNGVESVINELGTKKFIRLRMGINSENPSFSEPISRGEGLESIVLKNFSNDEQAIVEEMIRQAIKKLKELIQTKQ
ncbi:MAG: aminoacyl-tRNA hydrolase [Candidatus Pacebacteria bacterium]|nr:aminoacyl-tRNA hydrolase [Candidatus Paceibacterota bacterium]